jgi:hypothetical protein
VRERENLIVRSKLEAVLLGQLKRGEHEQFEFREEAELLLVAALEADLDGPDPTASVRGALKYCAAFDAELASPSAAIILRAILRGNSRVVRMLKENVLDERPIDRMRRFVRGEGREIVLKAPMFDAARRQGGQSWPKN